MKNTINTYRNFVLITLLCCSCFYCSHANAMIYKTVDENGDSHFSDTPQKNATLITLKPLNHYTSTHSINSNTTPNSQEKINKAAYKKFAIASPKDQQTFQNTSEISVELQLQPGLKAGDGIEFSLDGRALPVATDTRFVLNEIERGEHTLQARLLNSEQKVLMTTTVVTIYVHQASSANSS